MNAALSLGVLARAVQKLRLSSKQEAAVPQGQEHRSFSGASESTASTSIHTVAHFIASPGGGGAEAMLRNLVSAMDHSKWRTVVIVMDGRPWPDVVARLREAGVEVHDLEAAAFLKKDTLVKLVRLLRQIRPDLLQTWMHHADFVGGWCARLAGVRQVVWGIHCREIHANPGDSPLKMQVFRQLLGWSSRWVPARVISCSAAAMEDHVPLGYPIQRMKWVPNGIDTSHFVPDVESRQAIRRELRVPDEAQLVGYIGRFHEMKDLATWLRAAALLQLRKPGVHFWLCGGDEMELNDCARAALSVMPHRHQIHFTPFRADPQRAYPALDLFSLSSRTEACPMTVMEALSCGVPCVTTDVGDCARLLEGVGLVASVRDPEALARAWEEVLAHPTAAQVLRAHATSRFDIAVAARGYETVYREVLEA